jgi:hypothetical protein
VREAVKECVHAPLADEDFQIKDGVLRLTAGPMMKSEFRLKEAEILSCLEGKIGKKVTRVAYY